MHAYYYIVASLPELTLGQNIDDNAFDEIFSLINRNLTAEDRILFTHLRYPADILTIVNVLSNSKKLPKHYPLVIGPPTLTKEQAGKIITHTDPAPKFIQNIFEGNRDWADEDIFEIEKALTEGFYESVLQVDDEFLRAYFQFDKDLRNITMALNARQYQFDKQPYFINHEPVNVKIKQSHSPDFGLSEQYPFVDKLLTKVSDKDPTALEKYLDELRWNFIDDFSRSSYFNRQIIFGYFIKLQITYRWSTFKSTRDEEKIIDILATGALEQFKFKEFLEAI